MAAEIEAAPIVGRNAGGSLDRQFDGNVGGVDGVGEADGEESGAEPACCSSDHCCPHRPSPRSLVSPKPAHLIGHRCNCERVATNLTAMWRRSNDWERRPRCGALRKRLATLAIVGRHYYLWLERNDAFRQHAWRNIVVRSGTVHLGFVYMS